MIFYDSAYLLFALPGLALALFAQFLVWLNYNRFSKEAAGSGITGVEAAKKIDQGEGYNVELQLSPGKLNDSYNPLTNKVNLSSDNAQSGSVANIAVVAHEFGHVQQRHEASLLFSIRTGMVPIVNIGSSLGYILFIAGLFFALTGLVNVGLILFSLTTVFAILTLPIEFDASRRGMEFIKKYRLIDTDKLGGAKKVLNAAALTYVAAVVQSLGQLLYFFSIANRRRN